MLARVSDRGAQRGSGIFLSHATCPRQAGDIDVGDLRAVGEVVPLNEVAFLCIVQKGC